MLDVSSNYRWLCVKQFSHYDRCCAHVNRRSGYTVFSAGSVALHKATYQKVHLWAASPWWVWENFFFFLSLPVFSAFVFAVVWNTQIFAGLQISHFLFRKRVLSSAPVRSDSRSDELQRQIIGNFPWNWSCEEVSCFHKCYLLTGFITRQVFWYDIVKHDNDRPCSSVIKTEISINIICIIFVHIDPICTKSVLWKFLCVSTNQHRKAL